MCVARQENNVLKNMHIIFIYLCNFMRLIYYDIIYMVNYEKIFLASEAESVFFIYLGIIF